MLIKFDRVHLLTCCVYGRMISAVDLCTQNTGANLSKRVCSVN